MDETAVASVTGVAQVFDLHALKAFAPGGASSGFLPASMADTPLDFRSLAAVGSMLGSIAAKGSARTCACRSATNFRMSSRGSACSPTTWVTR